MQTDDFNTDKHVILDGDKVKSATWMPFAKSQVDKLYAQSIATSGCNYSKEFTPDENTLIRVSVNSYIKYIYIKSTGGCGTFISGIGRHHRLYYEQNPLNPNDKTDVKTYMYEFFPSFKQSKKDKSGRGWQKEERLTADLSSVYNIEMQFPSSQNAFLKSSLYTGKMRKMVQIQLGMNKTIEWDFRFQKTHGLYVNPRGVMYIIEISPNGIFSFKMSTCSIVNKQLDSSVPNLPISLGFPSGEDLIDALASGSVVQLANAKSMEQFYSKSPFFEACGWAFNPSGLESQNTCWSWPEDGYKRAHRFKVNIYTNTGKPSAATLTMVEESVMYMPVKASGFQIPKELSSNVLITFNMQKDQGSPDYTGTQNAPLYVYYEDDGSECVCYKSHSGLNDNFVLQKETGYDSDWEVTAGEARPLLFKNFGSSYKKRENGYNRSALFGYSTKYHQTQNEEASANETVKGTYSPEFVGVAINFELASGGGSYNSYNAVLYKEFNSNVYKSFESALVIPSMNRSSHIYFSRTQNNIGTQTKYQQYYEVGYPNFTSKSKLESIDKTGIPRQQWPATLTVEGGGSRSFDDGRDWMDQPPGNGFASYIGEEDPFPQKTYGSFTELYQFTSHLYDKPGYPMAIAYATSKGCNAFPSNQMSISLKVSTSTDVHTYNSIYRLYNSKGFVEDISENLPIYPRSPADLWGGTGPTVVISNIKDAFSENFYLKYDLNSYVNYANYGTDYSNYVTINGIPVYHTSAGMSFIGIPF